jgi:hypothetical protein
LTILEEFNNERPHQALDMKFPVEVYTPSTRPYRGLPELDYPFHDKTADVTSCGRICLHRKKINLSRVFAGQAVGIKEVVPAPSVAEFVREAPNGIPNRRAWYLYELLTGRNLKKVPDAKNVTAIDVLDAEAYFT